MRPNDVRVGQGAWHKPFLLHSHAGSAARIPSSGDQCGGPEPTLEIRQRDPVGPGTAPGNEKCHTQGRAARSKRRPPGGGSIHGAFLPVSCAPASGAHWHQLRFHPNNFPQRLKRFQEETGLSWSEPARHLETNSHTVWRWAEGRVRPNCQHRKALVELCDSLGLGLMCYTIPMPDDSPIPGRNAEGMALNGSALAFVRNGGPYGK